MRRALSLVLAAPLVAGYSFTFTSQPQQCADLSLQITGSGQPPYSVLIIPYGPTPLPNNVEVRTILYQQFSGNASSLSFQLKYPASSQFVAVVSDSSGFGSGGTSVAATVMSSSDASCFNASHTVSPDFVYNIYPPNQVVQCSPSRLWWNSSQVQGTTSFQGVIPGGDSFSIPLGTIVDTVNTGSGFEWTPAVRAGSTLLLVAGDSRGLGSGGSDLFTVSAGLNPNSSCISNTSPSSTAGPPAGGSYPTNASGSTTGGGSTSSSNTRAIVGGVIGGLGAIVILGLTAFYVIRRKTAPKRSKERPVNLLLGDPDDNEPSNYQPPPYLQPEPYLVTAPTPTLSSSFSDGIRQSIARSALLSESLSSTPYGSAAQRQSVVTSVTDPRSATPELVDVGVVPAQGGSAGGLSNSRKSGMSRQLRAVNIIQHEDAGPSGNAPEGAQPETIELPPAYTRIQRQS